MYKARGAVITAVAILMVVASVSAITLSYVMSFRARSNTGQLRSNQSLYVAEAGLEVASQKITDPNPVNRISCDAVNGHASLTNSKGGWSSLPGTFTVTSIPQATPTKITASLTASATTVRVSSVATFPSQGQIMIDREAVNYFGTSTSSVVCGGTPPCFTGLARGKSGTMASAHCVGAAVVQSTCALTSTGGVPSDTTDAAKRTITTDLSSPYLGDGWVGGKAKDSQWNVVSWKGSREPDWKKDVIPPAVGPAHDFIDISVVSSADVWAINREGSVLRYDGVSWEEAGLSISGKSQYVSAVSACEVWLVNDKNDILRWTGGTTWTLVDTVATAVKGISMKDTTGTGTADIGWVVGNNGNASRWNGSSWSANTSGLSSEHLVSVSTISSNSAWTANFKGDVFKWNGSSWVTQSPPGSLKKLSSISMIPSGNVDIGWAVADRDGFTRNNAFYFNGTSWSLLNTNYPDKVKNGKVVTVAPNFAIMISDESIMHWDGTAWTLLSDAVDKLLSLDIVALTPTSVSNWREIFK